MDTLLYGIIIFLVNIILQSFFTIYWLKFITQRLARDMRRISLVFILIYSIICFTLLHVIQASIWAIGYLVHPEFTQQLTSFNDALYFSIVTFTTLGYGDIVLKGSHRVLSGIAAMNGTILLSLSTAILFVVIQKVYQKLKN